MTVQGLDKLCTKYEIKTLTEELDAARRSGGGEVHELAAEDLGGWVNGSAVDASPETVRLLSDHWQADDPFSETGVPGTPVIGGMVQVEPTPKYGPYQVRGYAGFHALYEKYYRQEPILFEGINEGNNLFTSGKVRFVEPNVPKSQKSAAKEFTEWCNRWWNNMWRGPQYFQRHLGAAKIFGFYAHEIVWSVDHKGRIFPTKLAPREPSTVDKWIMTPRGDALQAVSFMTTPVSSGNSAKRSPSTTRYTLTADGPRLTDNKILISNVFARANNFEGIAYARPNLHWIKFKQVLAQIAAVTAQKYGVPVPVVQAKMVQGSQQFSSAKVDTESALEAVTSIEAAEGAAVVMPPGVNVSMIGAQGGMPNHIAMFEYADSMIERPLASEAAGLGSGTVGSYALADVLDNRLLRAQPGFASEVLQPINWLTRDIAAHHKIKLDAYPEALWTMDGFADSSRWVADATKLMGGAPMWDWPKKMQKQALYKLDLDASTFDDFEPPEINPEPTMFGWEPDKEMSDHTKCCGGAGPEEWVRILAGDIDDSPGTHELGEIIPPVDARRMSPEAIGKKMDLLQKRLGREINPVMLEMQREWRTKVRDGRLSVADGERFFRTKYRPIIENVFIDAQRNVVQESKRELLRDYGFTVGDDVELPGRSNLEPALQAAMASTVAEILNRQIGYMMESAADSLQTQPDDPSGGVPRLKEATVAAAAGAVVNRSWSAGRADLMEVAREDNPKAPRIKAYYSSMMDGERCKVCASLDFEDGDTPAVHFVGTAAYYKDMPPARCLGGPKRCRCAYVFDVPVDYAESFEKIASGDFVMPPAERR